MQADEEEIKTPDDTADDMTNVRYLDGWSDGWNAGVEDIEGNEDSPWDDEDEDDETWGDAIKAAALVGAVMLVIAVFVISMVAVTADHRVLDYYIGTPPSSFTGTIRETCVYANTPWAEDAKVYCSTDPNNALAFARAANCALIAATPRGAFWGN